MTGGKLGHYDVLEKLGEGGMGVVYKAHDPRLNRIIAIKLLPAAKAADAARRQRFLQEARALSALNHPNIVIIHDMVEEGGLNFLVMEYVSGKTLAQMIPRRGLPATETLRYATQIADALTAAHEAGVIHRDLKPGNIMTTEKGVVKILDFGLAKLLDSAPVDPDDATRTVAAITDEGTIVGTVAYMSPEQAEGKPADARSDIFSFGAVLYEMLTGQRAFQGETRMSTLSAILREEPKPIRAAVPEVPAELERIVNRCLRKDPHKRFQHCDDLQIALDELKHESDSGALALPAHAAKARRAGKRLWIAAAVVATAAIGTRYVRSRNPAETGPAQLTRITTDSGLTTHPALSPDGKLLAYASDRASSGDNLDIWVQHIAGGDPVQLTKDPADESEPDFAPDGSRIAFSSTRGGIYVIPVLGGEARQLVSRGSRPRFSPDGKWIAYHVAASGTAMGTTLREVWVISSTGGAPRRMLPNFIDVSYPIWSPDGQSLLMLGRRNSQSLGSVQYEWWVSPLQGAEPVAVGRSLLPAEMQGGSWAPNPATWSGEFLLFSLPMADHANLWRVRLKANPWRFAGKPERLTYGTAFEEQPSVDANGTLVLASTQFSSDLWMLPIDAARGKVTGELQRLTEDPAEDDTTSITPDGNKVVFLSNRGGQTGLWMRDSATGKLTKVSPPGRAWPWPQITDDARKVSFHFVPPGGQPRYVVSDLTDGTMQELELELRQGWGVSPSGEFVIEGGGSNGIALRVMRLLTKETHDAITHPQWHLLSPHFSHDERWITLHVRNSEFTRQIFIVPFRFGRAATLEEWIPVTEGKSLDRDPAWSPDGNMLYWLADRNGVRGIYARKLDPTTKHPVGPEFEVRMFRGTRRSMNLFANSGLSRPAVARDRIVFALGERIGNIWMTRLPKP
jgi:Tol biopolymer transport system component/predicted Ser/Thr protein kinase